MNPNLGTIRLTNPEEVDNPGSVSGLQDRGLQSNHESVHFLSAIVSVAKRWSEGQSADE